MCEVAREGKTHLENKIVGKQVWCSQRGGECSFARTKSFSMAHDQRTGKIIPPFSLP